MRFQEGLGSFPLPEVTKHIVRMAPSQLSCIHDVEEALSTLKRKNMGLEFFHVGIFWRLPTKQDKKEKVLFGQLQVPTSATSWYGRYQSSSIPMQAYNFHAVLLGPRGEVYDKSMSVDFFGADF